jgi:hypothetical protein
MCVKNKAFKKISRNVNYLFVIGITMHEVRSSMAPRSVRIGVRSRKLSNIDQSLDG